jgi:hypothetical protein
MIDEDQPALVCQDHAWREADMTHRADMLLTMKKRRIVQPESTLVKQLDDGVQIHRTRDFLSLPPSLQVRAIIN